MNDSTIVVPNFITPTDISMLDDKHLDALIKRIQDCRMHSYHIFLEAEEMRMKVRDEKLRTKLAKQAGMLKKEITRADKVLVVLNKRINNIRAIKLEIGDV